MNTRHGQATSTASIEPPTAWTLTNLGGHDEAATWLCGEGDLLTAGMGRPVPPHVQLGVLAHGSPQRLADLGRHARRGAVRRYWGAEMAGLAGEIGRAASTRGGLERLQREVLVPLEDEVLSGRRVFATRQVLIEHLRDALALPVNASKATRSRFKTFVR